MTERIGLAEKMLGLSGAVVLDVEDVTGELVGYLRFDAGAELAQLNRICTIDRGYTTLLLTQQKLVESTRVGAKVIKRHDGAASSRDG